MAKAAAPLRLLAQGSLRELFESLSMGAQFRFTAIAAVTVTLLTLQVLVTFWDTWSARSEALAFADRKLTSMAERLEATSGGALDDLQDHPVFLEAALTLPVKPGLNSTGRSR